MGKLLAPVGPPTFCQSGLIRFVAACTWYGGTPPDQLNNKLPPCNEMVEIIGAASLTARFSVAVSKSPPASVTPTTKLLLPTSLKTGTPESEPSAATASQFGPLTFANVNASSGFGSLAFVAIVPE